MKGISKKMGLTKQSENREVVKAAGIVGGATLVSRFFGYIRDMVVAFFFGAGLVSDAFFVAFRIPNMLRRLVGEGSMTVSFIPVFTDYLQNKSKKDALELANIVFCLLSILLAVIAVAGIVFSPLIIKLTSPGFSDSPRQYELAVFLNRLMFPYIFFISLVALAMGILNAFRHFAVPAFSPVVLNISMILSACFLRDFFSEPITALAIGVLIGGVLQLAMQFPYLLKFGFKLRPDFNFRHPGIKKIVSLMLPAMFGSAIYQINVFVGTILASLLPKGSVSYLYYADRIVELPLGIFGIALGTAILPTLSQQVASGNVDEMRKTISFSLRVLLFVTIPAMCALIFLRLPIISVLFGRGEFSFEAVKLTADALLYYSLGLCAFSSVRIVSSGFFALNDTKTPMKAAIIALVVNLVCSLLLMFPLKHAGLALATTISSTINVGMLAIILHRRIGVFIDKRFITSFVKIMVCSAIMSLFILCMGYFYPFLSLSTFSKRLLWLMYAVAGGGGCYLLTSYFLGSDEMFSLKDNIKRRFLSK
ncbi:MAG: murein biosynthesis integral membrane protein MurJ [Deltaproteobacteria bacterium]